MSGAFLFNKRVKDGSGKRIGKYRVIVEKTKEAPDDLWRLKIYQKGETEPLFKSIEYAKKEIIRLYRNITTHKDINRILIKK